MFVLIADTARRRNRRAVPASARNRCPAKLERTVESDAAVEAEDGQVAGDALLGRAVVQRVIAAVPADLRGEEAERIGERQAQRGIGQHPRAFGQRGVGKAGGFAFQLEFEAVAKRLRHPQAGVRQSCIGFDNRSERGGILQGLEALRPQFGIPVGVLRGQPGFAVEVAERGDGNQVGQVAEIIVVGHAVEQHAGLGVRVQAVVRC